MAIIKFEMVTRLVTKRSHARIMREVLRATMLNHREKRLGKHYKDIPETKPGGAYGYEPRGAKYIQRKARKKGHNKPLVWSGQLQRFVRNNGQITATQHRARFKTPRLPKRSNVLIAQFAREIEAISRDEADREIPAEIHGRYLKEAGKPENQRERRAKGGGSVSAGLGFNE